MHAPQRAQPIRWGLWMLSYGLAFDSDPETLREVIKHIIRKPLRCCALTGNRLESTRYDFQGVWLSRPNLEAHGWSS
ncbi:hypothetical protein HDV64DRAFT_264124 [Trichoderma sp. TUCIM 5745]